MSKRSRTTSARVCAVLSLAALSTISIAGTPLIAHAEETPGQKLNETSDVEKVSADHLAEQFGLSPEDALGRVRDQEKHAETAHDSSRSSETAPPDPSSTRSAESSSST